MTTRSPLAGQGMQGRVGQGWEWYRMVGHGRPLPGRYIFRIYKLHTVCINLCIQAIDEFMNNYNLFY